MKLEINMARFGGGAAIAAVAATLLLSQPTKAAIILESPGLQTFQQQQNSPCVVGDNSCKQPAGFGSTLLTVDANNEETGTSPAYTLAQLTSVVGAGLSFTVGIDVNTTSALPHETLVSFETFICNSAGNNCVRDDADSYLGPSVQLADVNNGNGFSDDLLKGFNLTGDLTGNNTVKFAVDVTHAFDGLEQFFLISSTATPVPEPASLAIFG